MPIKIHHGPPGSYKTAGAMGDDFLREARAGRVIVTNVRGVSRDRCLEQFPDLPDSFDVIWVDDKEEAGREKWSKWFHWVPKGAFIFLDEVQDLWPKRWKESDIRALDYPGGLKQATKDDRPFCWEQAFDKHRHFNWDMVLTTPKYSKIRDDVRGVAEMSYKHKNLAIIGWGGRYIEAAHLADDDGGSPSHFLSVNKKKVPGYVFNLYDSTQTGQITDSKTGINILKNPRVAFLLLVIFGAVAYFLLKPAPAALGGSSKGGVSASSAAGSPSAQTSGAASGPLAGGRPAGGNHLSHGLGPFEGESVFINISVKIKNQWRYVVNSGGVDFTQNDLLDMGYAVTSFGSCGVQISRGDWKRFISCGQSASGRTPPAPLLAPAPPVPVLTVPAVPPTVVSPVAPV